MESGIAMANGFGRTEFVFGIGNLVGDGSASHVRRLIATVTVSANETVDVGQVEETANEIEADEVPGEQIA